VSPRERANPSAADDSPWKDEWVISNRIEYEIVAPAQSNPASQPEPSI
jgi:hypothetical protein